MMNKIPTPPDIKRTTTNDPDFLSLTVKLDHELWNELNEDQQIYDPLNKVNGINTALVLYVHGMPVACGCYKQFDTGTVEIKRMFVDKPYRGYGFAKQIVLELEKWAMENGNRFAVLETSIHFTNARGLYERCGFSIIPNYPPYTSLSESVCMKKEFPKLVAGI